MKRVFFTVMIAALVSACETVPEMKYTRHEMKLIHIPDLNIVTEGEIGRTLVSKVYSTKIPVINVTALIEEYRKQPATNNRFSGTLLLPEGVYKMKTEDDSGWYYPVPKPGVYKISVGSVPCSVCGIFVPKSDPQSAYTYYFYEQMGSKGIEIGKEKVVVNKSTIDEVSTDSLKMELVYGGMSQKVISISYREFKNDFARPAFTQELKYDLNEGDTIGFRGARFQVIKANNTSLTYKVLKHLD